MESEENYLDPYLNGFENAVLDLVDKVIISYPDYSDVSMLLIAPNYVEGYSPQHKASLMREAKIVLRRLDYVEDGILNREIHLTELGRFVKKLGGHYKYLEYQSYVEQKEQERHAAELENNYYSAKVNKYLHKTRWLPHIIALIALIISIIALLKEDNKENSKEEMTQAKIKKL